MNCSLCDYPHLPELVEVLVEKIRDLGTDLKDDIAASLIAGMLKKLLRIVEQGVATGDLARRMVLEFLRTSEWTYAKLIIAISRAGHRDSGTTEVYCYQHREHYKSACELRTANFSTKITRRSRSRSES